MGMCPGPSIITCTSYSQAFLVSSPRTFSSANLCLVAGVRQAAGAQAITQREGNIVFLENLADVRKVRIEEILLIVLGAPLCHDGAAAAHNAGDPPPGERDEFAQHRRREWSCNDALLGLLLDHFQHEVAESGRARD